MPVRTASLVRMVMCLAAMSACAVWFRNATPANENPYDAVILAEGETLKWRKGNLHTHTLWSDGDDYLEAVARWYKDRNYDFLSITDHNTIDENERWVDVAKTKGGLPALEKLQEKFPQDWIVKRVKDDRREVRLKMFSEVAVHLNEADKFLLIRGEEISDKFGSKPIHLNATNIKDAIPPLGGDSVTDVIQRNVDALLSQRERTGQPMLIHLNHPNFGWGVTAEELMRVRGENFFEVYNGHPGVNNSGNGQHAGTERMWDIINAFRLTEHNLPLMYGLGTDDGHNYHKIPSRASEPGRAWVMVLTGELTPEAIVTAMEAGRFYASNGVNLERIEAGKRRLAVEVRPEPGVEYQIEFIGTRRGFDPQSEPVQDKDGKPLDATRKYSAGIGVVLKSVSGIKGTYDFAGDELYVRARITSTKPHPNPSETGDKESAWVQPVAGPGVAK